MYSYSLQELTSEKEVSGRMIQTLQSHLQTLQKSDTILRQKYQHDKTLKSLEGFRIVHLYLYTFFI